MDFALNDTQREIQDGAAKLMAELSPLDAVVALTEADQGWDPASYRKLAELGWTGLHVPEQHGGVGLGYVELAVVLEQMGAVLHPSPFFASVCLAANALLEGAALEPLSSDNAALLAAIAAGERTASVAYLEPGSGENLDTFKLEARSDGSDFLLSGTKHYVIDGHTADSVITAALDSSGELILLSVDGDAPGLTRQEAHTVDRTRRVATLTYEDVRVPASAMVGTAQSGANVLADTARLARVALAAESLGAAQHAFDTALAYTKDRYQFGRPIASFQAVKHICADLLMAVEGTRSAAYYAAWVAAERREELARVAPLAKAQAAEALWDVARASIQLHGGIGFTFEHEAHYYYRRATATRALLGSTSFNRQLLLYARGA